MKKHISTVILCAVFLVGLCVLLYPTVSDYWNSKHASKAIADYNRVVTEIPETDYSVWLDAARDYNDSLTTAGNRFYMSDEAREAYDKLLDVSGTGIMGYIEVPKVGIYLPIYHGTDDATLEAGIGHLEGSSLPIGGTGTHCALTGHRGMPSAKLFTDLDRVAEGDFIFLHVLGETLAYQVDQIRIVLPEELDELEIDPEHDYCTLITCTPYGVNSHRMLVRGHRVEYTEATEAIIRVEADAVKLEPMLIAPVIAAPILILLLIRLLLTTRPARSGKKRGGRSPKNNGG